MIEYSLKALKTLPFLFRHYNDVDIYVEDATCRNMYELLINRMLEGESRVERIFQLGGRIEVINRCRDNEDDNSRRRLFIIDGDFDIVLDKPSPDLDNLYRLTVYCSENLVFTQKAALEVAYDAMTNKPREKIADSLELPEYFVSIIRKLTPLFTIYIAVQILEAGIKTTGYNVMEFLEHRPKDQHLSETKISARITEIKSELLKEHSEEEIQAAIAQAEELLPDSHVEISKLISGKTYLLPLLRHYLQIKASYRGRKDQLKTHLARHCELDVDEGLLEAVQRTAKTRVS